MTGKGFIIQNLGIGFLHLTWVKYELKVKNWRVLKDFVIQLWCGAGKKCVLL
jgi:hypothetical protein